MLEQVRRLHFQSMASSYHTELITRSISVEFVLEEAIVYVVNCSRSISAQIERCQLRLIDSYSFHQ
ncbi:hypothetical protein AHF37_07316 [Paragonimus kellicotti]|nr:hypothetical protein AHF37_07316 [Paragonimus kellicotti]